MKARVVPSQGKLYRKQCHTGGKGKVIWNEHTMESMAQTASLQWRRGDLSQRPGHPSMELDEILRRKLMAFKQPSSPLSLPFHFQPRGSLGHGTPGLGTSQSF